MARPNSKEDEQAIFSHKPKMPAVKYESTIPITCENQKRVKTDQLVPVAVHIATGRFVHFAGPVTNVHDARLFQEGPLPKMFDRLDEVLELRNDDGKANIGFCLDTCHAFAAGACRFDSVKAVDIYFEELNLAFGLKRLKLIHLNDSMDKFGDMKDNHAPLTQGNIWSDPDCVEGLIRLWELAKEHEIDIVSEVGSEVDVEVMKMLSN